MEISLEKIELVKDRTGVSYKDAKEALIKAEGNVLDAIIMIEEEIDITPQSKAEDSASRVIEYIKSIVRKGNVSKILIKKDGNVVLNIPVNLGILGLIFEPWAMLLATIVSIGTKCTIDIVKNNGEVINVSEKATETFSDVREKGADAFVAMKDQASSVINKVKNEQNIKFWEKDFYDDEEIEIEVYGEETGYESTEEDAIDVYGDEEDSIKFEESSEKFEEAVNTYKNKI